MRVWRVTRRTPRLSGRTRRLTRRTSTSLCAFTCTQRTWSTYCALALALDTLTSSNLREVVVIPNEKWGGSGLLGCGVG